MLSVAANNPMHVSWYNDGSNVIKPSISSEPTQIGVSANTDRRFFRTADYTAVQRPDMGLFFRASPGGGIVQEIRVPTDRFLVADPNIPASAARIVYFDSVGQGVRFTDLGSPTGSGRRILKLTDPNAPLPAGADDIIAYSMGLPVTSVTATASNVTLPGTSSAGTNIVVALTTVAGEEIWRLKRTTGTSSNIWPKPAGLTPAAPFIYSKLTQLGLDSAWTGSLGYLVDGANIPASAAKIAYFDGTGWGYPLTDLGAHAGSGKRILELTNPADSPPAAAADIVAFSFGTASGSVTTSGADIVLPGTIGPPDIVAAVTAGTVEEIWQLGRNTGFATDDWPDPGVASGSPWTYNELIEAGRESAWVEAVLRPNGSEIETALSAGLEVWRAANTDGQGVELLKYGPGGAVAYPHADISDNTAYFLAAPKTWVVADPDRDANPSLSWEYWNGESWWALATDGSGADRLIDQTANFMKGGGVFFKVPADIQPTEVGGRTRHWLRVRVVGDYGQAKVTAISVEDPATHTTTQNLVRDVGAVRAPYITLLKLGYCAHEPVRPEVVLTEDSLGAIDQTSANEAGLDFPVFTPVAELMNPRNAAEEAAAAAAEAARCDDPCPPPPPGDEAACEAPGAYDSCDSPCVAPPGHRRAAAGEARGFVRGLMVGFTRPFAGDTISLYVDAEPSGPPVVLAADILRGGRFVPVELVGDTSHGLIEPGILTLAFAAPPDMSDLLGAPAHWLRLYPKADSPSWSPRLRGVHLNAVLARSVESRSMERLGMSVGVEDQEFRLAETPVAADSLVLRVREALADEDDPDGKLDVAVYPKGLPGQWVRWEAVDDLIEEKAEPGRVFAFDAEQGIIRFGNGRTGRIPPSGADILAERYAHVVGDRANGVEPGNKLQLLAPLAGVERTIALDHAAGGSDAEPLESARRRAAAKVRHGDRILTRADLEEHALTLSPAIAQVRADSRGGGMRLVVALKGREPQPLPAALHGFAEAVRAVAGFGLARPGGLDVVGPRLLPLALQLVLQPRSPDSFAEAASQARELLVALFDPETGNHDGRGWPMGRLPDAQDIAAALAPIDDLALPVAVTLQRADKETAAERALPKAIPSDVLVRLDRSAIAFEREKEVAA